eukprot:Hpha_TRINITY_DN16763_c3_g3::TRINITY_DN16763_c3_g3_i1::g.79577::m.79577
MATEEFTHEDFLRVLEMEGKPKGDKVTEQNLEEEAKERDKKLRVLAEKQRARQRGSKVQGDGEFEEYNHEDFIQAMTMMGRTAPVTAETLAREEKRRQEHEQRLSQVSYKKEEGLSLAQKWEKEHEAEESKAEQILRAELKQRPPPPPEPEPEPEAEPAKKEEPPPPTPPEPEKEPESGPDNQLLVGVGHKDVRNHCLAILQSEGDAAQEGEPEGDSAGKFVRSLKEGGTAVTIREGVEKGRDALRSHMEKTTPQNIAVVVVVDYRCAASEAEIDSLLADAQAPTKASPQPAVVVVYSSTQKHGVPPNVLEVLQRIHRPPYVLATVSWDTALRFALSNQSDVTLEEELAVKSNLVKSSDRKEKQGAAGMVITRGKDHDLRMHTSNNPVIWLDVGMHWKGEFDLDLSCILLNHVGAKINLVFFANLAFADGAFTHSGDIMTAPKGDKEAISVDLRRVPPEVRVMYFVITSYGGEQFQKVDKLDASVSVGDASGSKEVFAQMALDGVRDCTAIVLCRVYRTGDNSWGVTNVAAPHPRAETARALVYTAQRDFQSNPPPTWGPLS